MMPDPVHRFSGCYKDPLTLSLSQQARLGELATRVSRIRKRMRGGEGTPSQRAQPDSLSPWGEGWGEGVFANQPRRFG